MVDVIANFQAKVDRKSTLPCWMWNSTLNNKGYGVFSFYADGQRQTMLAHRVACMLNQGTLPKGAHVCHTCDTPSCVNPAHLFIGNNSVNMLDALAKGRSRPGGRVPLLQPHQVKEIRVLGRTGAYTAVQIAAMYGVRPHVITKVLNRTTWGHV